MKTGVEKIIQAKGGDAPAKNQTGVQKIIELLGGDPPAKNQTGVDKIVEILENGGGGGNPNTVQTITGTLANPFGDMTLSEISAFLIAACDGNASATIDIDGSIIQTSAYIIGGLYADGAGEQLHFSRCSEGSDFLMIVNTDWTMSYGDMVPESFSMTEASYTVFDKTEMTGEYTNLYDSAEYFPTTLTIIWHPLPDQS